jgi:hypothetical protein
MIYLRTLFITILLAGIHIANAQISFQKSYGQGNSGDYGQSVIESTEGDFFVAGVRVSQSGSGFSGEGLLMKTDPYGNEIWTKYYSTSGSDDLTFDYIQLTSDNHLLLTGVVNYGGSAYDAYITKINLEGEVIWSKNYGGIHRQRGLQGKETEEGGFIFAGWNEIHGNAGSISFFLFKTNENGDTLWTKTYPNNGMRQTGYAVVQNTDQGYLIAGSIQQPLQIGTDIFLMKTDEKGDLIWTKIIDNPGSNEARDIVIGNNGNIIVSGWSAASGCAQPILAEMNQEGDIQWIKAFDNGFCEWNYSMCQTEDGGFALFGMNHLSDFSLITTNETGIEKWSNQFHENQSDYGYCVRQTRDGGFVMCGINSLNAEINISLIKTNGSGIVTGLEESQPDENIIVFPNPATEEIYIEFPDNQILQMKRINLYNSIGQLIFSVNSENSKNLYLNINAVIPGIHILEISAENEVLSRQKIMISGK